MPITVTPNTTNVTISVGGTTTATASTSGSTAVTISATGPTGPAGADGSGSLTSTDQLTEGSSNLYHTSARARASISVSGNGISYNSSTGAIASLSTEIVGLSPGISVNNVPKFGSDVATAEYLKVSGVTVISRSVSEVLSDIGAFASSAVSTFGGTLIDDADANAARTTLGVSNVGAYTGQIETVAEKTYTLDPAAATARTITGLFLKTTSGSCTAKLLNGSSVVKESMTVNSSSGAFSSFANTTVAENSSISLVLTNNTTAIDLLFSVEYEE